MTSEVAKSFQQLQKMKAQYNQRLIPGFDGNHNDLHPSYYANERYQKLIKNMAYLEENL
jgi:hypothetical protein